MKKLVQDGIPVYFIDNEYYFKRDKLYGYDDDAERFAYFSKAALTMLHYIDFKPDVIHTNDWHTGLLGTYLKEDFMQDPYFQGMKEYVLVLSGDHIYSMGSGTLRRELFGTSRECPV